MGVVLYFLSRSGMLLYMSLVVMLRALDDFLRLVALKCKIHFEIHFCCW